VLTVKDVPQTKFRPEIEGLRALAVLLVLGYHFKVPGLLGGFAGVDVFFVVSGYLITSQILNQGLLDGPSLLDFYARRVRRIVPLATAVLVLTALTVLVLLGAARLRSLSYDFVASAVFLGNLPAAAAGEYLTGVSLPSPLRHFWSLAVEEQFYLFWPALVFFGLRFSRLDPIRLVRYIACLVAVPSFLVSISFSGSNPAWSYFMPHTRAWEIALGALVATMPCRSRPVVSWFSLPLLVVALSVLGSESVYPGWLAILPTAATALLLLSTDAAVGIGKILSLAPLRAIGALSFALYLWHWPALTVAEEVYGYLDWSGKLLVLGLTIFLSAGSYFLLETPVRFSKKLRRSPRRSLLIAPASMLLASFIPLMVLYAVPVATVSPSSPASAAPAPLPGRVLPPSSPLPAGSSTLPLRVARDAVLIGDSTLAPLRWFAGAARSLQGFPYVLDAESCRKLANRSCNGGRERRTPANAVEAIKSTPPGDTLVLMAGYHSYPDVIDKEFKAAISAARDRGYTTIVWLTFKESPEFPGVGSDVSVYTTFNRKIRTVIDAGEYDDVVLLDWNAYTSSRPDWFTPDGIHVNLRGSLGLGEFISSALAALDGRPCPNSPGALPCSIPQVPPSGDLLLHYGLEDTVEHCYEMGEGRTIECRPDKLQVAR